MATTEEKVVLVTGASSGIGKATATMLANKGYKVYGTSRKASFDELPTDSGAIRMIPLDVCDEASVDRAVEFIISKEGKIDVLVNNAGYGLAGSVEETSGEEAFKQFDANFFGMLRVCRRVIPGMRERGSGKIVNVSSVAGLFPIPFQSMYSASKYAIESATEAMRMELKPLGIKVSMVEPGDVHTGFTSGRQTAVAAAKGSVYGDRFTKAVNSMVKSELGGPGPEVVAKVVVRAVERKHPPVRAVVGISYKTLVFLKRFLPANFIEFVLAKMY